MLKNLRRFSAYLHAGASLKMILLAFFSQVIFAVFIIPKMATLINPLQNQVLLEMRFGYNIQQFYNLMDSLGETGRFYYKIYVFFIDLLYPVIYCISYSLLLSLFFRNSFSSSHYFQLFNVFPFLIGFADVFENLSVGYLLLIYPEKINFLVKLASSFSLLKWGFTMYNILLMLTGLFAWGFRTLLKAKK
ncbi:hypothetical protein [Lacihabitans soyangensis]|uniref:Uncharacterized protein n=1 Tax=Lacihabitans soyangensis TaxID=869394 RepID=A0AAE3GYE4_9BACT|nr:hypothetical protein [Lacihabitans soyangensis]MCP9761463.1 hypothetical protein [Lacihabitans soyangensis]